MLLRLPPELQTLVCKEASPCTLASLAQTSSYLLPLAQSVLYRCIAVDDRAARERFWGRRCNWRRSPHYDDPSTYTIFQTTLLSAPFHFGSFIVSLQVSSVFQEVTWDDLGVIFLAMPNLLRLRINLLDRGQDTTGVKALCRVTPRLQEFSSASTLVCPDFVTFLKNHPNLTIWRHGTEQGSAVKKWEPPSPIPDHLLTRFTQYEAQINVPELSAPILRGMTNLTHLALDFYIDSPLISYKAGLKFDGQFVEAITICGRNLRYFAIGSLWATKVPGDHPFIWSVQNLVCHMPILQHLQCGDWPEEELKQEDIDIVRSTIPATLRTFRLYFTFHDRRAIMLDEGFDHAFASARLVTRLLPTVTKFVYRDYCLTSTIGGEWSREESKGDMWTPDWGYEL